MCAFHFFFFSSRRRHTRYIGDWSSDVCSSDLELARKLFPNQQAEQERWMVVHKDALLDEGRLKIWWPRFVPSFRPIRSCLKRSALRPTTLRKIPSACAIPNSAHNICSSARVSSKPAARP